MIKTSLILKIVFLFHFYAWYIEPVGVLVAFLVIVNDSPHCFVHSMPNPTAEQIEFRFVGWAMSVATSLTITTHEFKCVCSIIIPSLFLS